MKIPTILKPETKDVVARLFYFRRDRLQFVLYGCRKFDDFIETDLRYR